jgi:hypothetical protein
MGSDMGVVQKVGTGEERVAVVPRARFKSPRRSSSHRDGLRRGASRALVAVVAAVLLLAVGGAVYASFPRTPPSTNATSTPPSTSTAPSNGQPSGVLYNVTFQQDGACSPEFWGVPWAVTIGDHTWVQPAGTALPLNDYSIGSTTNEALSTISFLLPNGFYQYEIHPSEGFFTPDSGVVNVNGADVTVNFAYTGTSCTTTIGSSP